MDLGVDVLLDGCVSEESKLNWQIDRFILQFPSLALATATVRDQAPGVAFAYYLCLSTSSSVSTVYPDCTQVAFDLV